MPSAKAFHQFVGGGAGDANAFHGNPECISAHLREYGLMALTGAGRTYIDVDRTIRRETYPRVLLRTASAALDK